MSDLPSTAKDAAGISTSWVTDLPTLASLAPVWDSLLARCDTISPFMRWDWIWAWANAHKDLFRPAVCIAEEAGQVIGIAPFTLGREENGSRRKLTQLGFMGGLGEAQGERLNLLIPAERINEIAPILLGRLSDLDHQWDAVRLNRIPAESTTLHHLTHAIRKITHNTGAGVLNSTACRYLQMPFDTWEAFQSSRSKNWRRKTKALKRRLTTELDITFHHGAVSPTGENVAEALFRLHRAQFGEQQSLFISPRALQVHRQLIPKWSASGQTEMCYLMSAGRIVSIVQIIREGAETFAFQTGRDTTLGDSAVGTAAFAWAVEHAFQTGSRSIDFLAGDFEYKRRWTQDTRIVLDLEGYAPSSWRARLFLTFRWLRRRFQQAPGQPTTEESVSEDA
jgi:CelD/BcsL family acetyltransferase involved in cellulose biosynthesis